MQQIDRETYKILKKSFDWLDSDKDEQISIKDIQTSCGISTEEANSLFKNLSTNSESFIKFQEFCEGVLSFPSLIDQFKSDQQHAERVSIDSISPLNQICQFFNIPTQGSEDDRIELISAQMFQIGSQPKSKIIEISQCFFKSFLNLQDFCRALQEQQSCQKLEHSLQQENLLRQKSRCENNYSELLKEYKDVEMNLKGMEENILCWKSEKRELEIKIAQSRDEGKEIQRNLEEMEELVKRKEKVIGELNKKLQVKSALVHIDGWTERETHKKKVKSVKFSKTPRGNKVHDFEPKETENAKDTVMRNLKKQLEEKTLRCQYLEVRLAEFLKDRQELLEKVRILSIRSRKASDDEEEFPLDTLESLRDELYQVDFNTRPSLQSPFPSSKDFSVQVEILDRKKSRLSCFSFFS